jgi:hypothetical protein
MSSEYYTPTTLTAHSRGLVAGPNNEFTGIDAGFQMLPSVDNIKRGKISDAVDSGAANAYILTATHAKATYANGDTYRFKALSTNSTTSTVNIYNASSVLIGSVEIKNYAGASLSGGEIVAGAWTTIAHDGTYFRITNPVTAVASVSVNNNVKATSADTTPGTIADKVVAGTGIDMATLNGGGNESREISVDTTELEEFLALTGKITDTLSSGTTAMTARRRYRISSTATGTLPTMGAGDFLIVEFTNGAGVTATVARNSQTIDGAAEDDTYIGTGTENPVIRYDYASAGVVTSRLIEVIP